MTIRQRTMPSPAGYPHGDAESSANRGQISGERQHARQELLARSHVLGRAYPLAKQLAEILELEDEGLAAAAKALRQRIGIALIGTPGARR